MGWTYQKTRGRKTLDIIRASIAGEIVASAVYLTEAYLAVRDENTGEVSGVVVLIHRPRGEIGIKIISERAGPLYYRAPARVLAVLSPTTDPIALGWRAICRDRLARCEGLKGDLTGRRFVIYGKTFRITGRHTTRRRSWAAVGEHNGQPYYIPPGLLKEADPAD